MSVRRRTLMQTSRYVEGVDAIAGTLAVRSDAMWRICVWQEVAQNDKPKQPQYTAV
jgi:hypothetical protein